MSVFSKIIAVLLKKKHEKLSDSVLCFILTNYVNTFTFEQFFSNFSKVKA